MADLTLIPAEALDARIAELDDEWDLVGDRLRRSFRFDDFARAMGFMAAVAIHAEKRNHHPEWSNVYNRVTVELTTHDAGGITELDLELAAIMDSLA